MSDFDYVATIDDSGGIEPLVKWGGAFVPGDHPITCITAMLLHKNALDDFNGEWLTLREQIRASIGCIELPPIHMRLMYGKKLPPKYRGRDNPYKDCDFEEIKLWVHRGARIIDRFQRRPQVLHWSTSIGDRRELAKGILRYFTDARLVAELEFMARYGKRNAKRSFAQRYLKKMASALLPLLTRKLIQLDEIMRQLRGKRVLLQVDPFADASGLDEGELLKAINQLFQLRHIAGIEVMTDADEVSLAQAADLIGFVAFRQAMTSEGYIQPDKLLFDLCAFPPVPDFVKANYEHIVDRRLQQKAGFGVSIHYAVARAVVEKMDPEFAGQYMLSVTDFYRNAQKRIPRLKGYSVLKPEALALINGEDPS